MNAKHSMAAINEIMYLMFYLVFLIGLASFILLVTSPITVPYYILDRLFNSEE